MIVPYPRPTPLPMPTWPRPYQPRSALGIQYVAQAPPTRFRAMTYEGPKLRCTYENMEMCETDWSMRGGSYSPECQEFVDRCGHPGGMMR